MKLYMMITKDEYELPIAIFETVEELAEFAGTTKQSIFSSISHAKTRRQRSRFIKIEIEDEEL